MMRKFFLFISLLGVSFGDVLTTSLDPFLTLPSAYSITPKQLDELFPKGNYSRNPYFQWLNHEQTRAIFKRHPASNLEIDLTILDGSVPVDELIVDFQDGNFLGCSISVYNRGDNKEKLSAEEFEARTQAIGKYITTQLDTKAKTRKENINKGVLTSGFIWNCARGIAALEFNEEAREGNTEFVRLRLAQKKAKGVYAAAMNDRSVATVRKSQLPNYVKKDGSTINIETIPMVDQGAKGYCVVASVQRIFEHYGISCDMHQLAEIADSDPVRGTSPLETNTQLGKIDYRFKTRYSCLAISAGSGLVELEDGQYVGDSVDQKDFEKKITRSIDKGIPVLWSLMLGKYEETPPLQNQVSGGHMRLITGYDIKERKLLFSDSWGAGHNNKVMNLDDAYKCTTGLYTLVPTTN